MSKSKKTLTGFEELAGIKPVLTGEDQVDPETGEVEEKVFVDILPRFPSISKTLLRDTSVQDRIAVDWDEDPGIGMAILLPDGREVVNPVPMAPPLGYKPEPTMMELMDAMVKRHLASLKSDDELDGPEDFEDFDVGDDVEPYSPYEVVLHDEFPAIPPAPPPQGDEPEKKKEEATPPPSPPPPVEE